MHIIESDHNVVETPVPIPNTEVKHHVLCCGTAPGRETHKLLSPFKK